MRFCVYILFSKKLNRFYVGTTDDINKRLEEHNSIKYDDSYTVKGIPWEIVIVLDFLESKQAFAIEKHIKAMKSSKYIQNLIAYPEMQKNLLEKFK